MTPTYLLHIVPLLQEQIIIFQSHLPPARDLTIPVGNGSYALVHSRHVSREPWCQAAEGLAPSREEPGSTPEEEEEQGHMRDRALSDSAAQARGQYMKSRVPGCCWADTAIVGKGKLHKSI